MYKHDFAFAFGIEEFLGMPKEEQRVKRLEFSDKFDQVHIDADVVVYLKELYDNKLVEVSEEI